MAITSAYLGAIAAVLVFVQLDVQASPLTRRQIDNSCDITVPNFCRTSLDGLRSITQDPAISENSFPIPVSSLLTLFCDSMCDPIRASPECFGFRNSSLVALFCERRPSPLTSSFCFQDYLSLNATRLRNATISACSSDLRPNACSNDCAEAFREEVVDLGCCAKAVLDSSLELRENGRPSAGACNISIPVSCSELPTPCSVVFRENRDCLVLGSTIISSLLNGNEHVVRNATRMLCTGRCRMSFNERPDCFASLRQFTTSFCPMHSSGEFCTVRLLSDQAMQLQATRVKACDNDGQPFQCQAACRNATTQELNHLGCCARESSTLGFILPANSTDPLTIHASRCRLALPPRCANTSNIDCPSITQTIASCSAEAQPIPRLINLGLSESVESAVRQFCSPRCVEPLQNPQGCIDLPEEFNEQVIPNLCSQQPGGQYCLVLQATEAGRRIRNNTIRQCGENILQRCSDSMCLNAIREDTQYFGCCFGRIVREIISNSAEGGSNLCGIEVPLTCPLGIGVPPTPPTVAPTLPSPNVSSCPNEIQCRTFLTEISAALTEMRFDVAQTVVVPLCNSGCHELMPRCFDLRQQEFVPLMKTWCTAKPNGDLCSSALLSSRNFELGRQVSLDCSREGCTPNCQRSLQIAVDFLGCCQSEFDSNLNTSSVRGICPDINVPPRCSSAMPSCSERRSSLPQCDIQRFQETISQLIVSGGDIAIANTAVNSLCTPQCADFVEDCLGNDDRNFFISTCSRHPDGTSCQIREIVGVTTRTKTITECEFENGIETTCPLDCRPALVEDISFFGCCIGTTVSLLASNNTESGESGEGSGEPGASLCGVTLPSTCPVVLEPLVAPTPPSVDNRCQVALIQLPRTIQTRPRNNSAIQEILHQFCSPMCSDPIRNMPQLFGLSSNQVEPLLSLYCSQHTQTRNFCIQMITDDRGIELRNETAVACGGLTTCPVECADSFRQEVEYLDCCAGTVAAASIEIANQLDVRSISRHADACNVTLPMRCSGDVAPPTIPPMDHCRAVLTTDVQACINKLIVINQLIQTGNVSHANNNVKDFCTTRCIAPIRNNPECFMRILGSLSVEDFVTTACSRNPIGNYCTVLQRLPAGSLVRNRVIDRCAFRNGIQTSCQNNCSNALIEDRAFFGCCSGTTVSLIADDNELESGESGSGSSLLTICDVEVPNACPVIVEPVASPLCPPETGFCSQRLTELFEHLTQIGNLITTSNVQRRFCALQKCVSLLIKMPACYPTQFQNNLNSLLFTQQICEQRPDGNFCLAIQSSSEADAHLDNIIETCGFPPNCSVPCVTNIRTQFEFQGCCLGSTLELNRHIGVMVPTGICGIEYSEFGPGCNANTTSPPPTTPPPSCPSTVVSLCSQHLQTFAESIRSRKFLDGQMATRALCNDICVSVAKERPGCYGALQSTARSLVAAMCSIRPDEELCGVVASTEEQLRLDNAVQAQCINEMNGSPNCSQSCRASLNRQVQNGGCCTTSVFVSANLVNATRLRRLYRICGVELRPACEEYSAPTPTFPTTTVPPTTTPQGCPNMSFLCLDQFRSTFSTINIRNSAVDSFCKSTCYQIMTQRPQCFPPGIATNLQVFCAVRPDGMRCATILNSALVRNVLAPRALSRHCISGTGYNCANLTCTIAHQQYTNELGCCTGTVNNFAVTVNTTFVPCGLPVPDSCSSLPNTTETSPITPITPTFITPVPPVTPTITIPEGCPNETRLCILKFRSTFFSRNTSSSSVLSFCTSECFDLIKDRTQCFDQSLYTLSTINCAVRPNGEFCGVYASSESEKILELLTRFNSIQCFSGTERREYNCSNIECLNAYNDYLADLGCCVGTSVELSNFTHPAGSCPNALSIPDPCPEPSMPTTSTTVATEPTLPPGCPAFTYLCQSVLDQILSSDESISLDDFCTSPCPNLVQNSPECFEASPEALHSAQGRCVMRPSDGQFCGAVLSSPEVRSAVQNLTSEGCARNGVINCLSSSCLLSVQKLIAELGCCTQSYVDIVSMSINCPGQVQIQPPCSDNRAPPLEVTFIDGSPVVGDDNVTARFITNKPVASLQCRLGENVSEFKNCSGSVIYTDLASRGRDIFVLHIQANTTDGEVFNLRRKFRIERPRQQHCSVYLLNEGNLAIGRSVIAEFRGVGPIKSYTCFMNGMLFKRPCTSPVTFADLPTGRHIFKITPFGCGSARTPVTFVEDIGNPVFRICRAVLVRPVQVSGGSATVEFELSGPFESFTCFIDNSEMANCVSPVRFNNMVPGRHIFKVRPNGDDCVPYPNRRPLRVDFTV